MPSVRSASSSPRSWITRLALVAALLAPGLGAQTDPAHLRTELWRAINAERTRAGLSPLALSPALERAAQGQADDLGKEGRLPSTQAGTTDTENRLHDAGYAASQWFANLISSTDPANEIVPRWRNEDAAGFRKLLDGKLTEIGIGLGKLNGIPLYTFIAAVPEGTAFQRETSGLQDLPRVRRELLEQINQQRRAHGLLALTPDSRLDQAAQHHAVDMLQRAYFAHESPERESVRERARRAGYSWHAVGENLAEGQPSVATVVDAWMKSRAHRENILNRDFTELGSGLALGRDPTGAYRILWVQVFGRPHAVGTTLHDAREIAGQGEPPGV
jgi:uncharacterized protein YkwD